MEETLTLIEKTAILKSSPVFGTIPTEALAQIASRARELHFDAGEVIFREGEVNRGAFMVVEGMVEIRKGRALDSMRGPGSGFGELAQAEGEPHEFTAVAKEPTHVLNVSNLELIDAILDFPEVGVAMVKDLSQRIAELAQRVHHLEGHVQHLSKTLRDQGAILPTYQSGAYRRPDLEQG